MSPKFKEVYLSVYQQVYRRWVQDHELFLPALHRQVSARVPYGARNRVCLEVELETNHRLFPRVVQETIRKEIDK